MRLKNRNLFTILCVVFLSGCTGIHKQKPRIMTLKPETSVSLSASTAVTYIRSDNDDLIVCSRSSPDALFDQGDAFSLSASLINTGNDSGGDSESSEEIEMAGRTPTVILAREVFYNTCEFSANYNLSKDEASTVFQKALDSIVAVWKIEAGNTTVTVGDTVTDSSSVGITLSQQDNISEGGNSTSSSSPSKTSTSTSTSSDSSSDDTTTVDQGVD